MIPNTRPAVTPLRLPRRGEAPRAGSTSGALRALVAATRSPFGDDHAAEALAKALKQVEFALAGRERAVAEAEARLAERERELAEGEALLRAKERLVRVSQRRAPVRAASPAELAAMEQLRAELNRQEKALIEGREALKERENFVAESEARLFDKVQEQQVKEVELEQREETLGTRSGSASGATAAVFDEFRE